MSGVGFERLVVLGRDELRDYFSRSCHIEQVMVDRALREWDADKFIVVEQDACGQGLGSARIILPYSKGLYEKLSKVYG